MFPFQDPIEAWQAWYAEAVAAEPDVPDAMQIATVDAAGTPHLRTVLAKQVDEAGVVFYTNLRSRKGLDLQVDPRIAATFHWKSLQRQVLVDGRVRPVRSTEADTYFASRPRASQLGAWASQQSEPIADREALEAAFTAAEERFRGGDVPRPPHWSGFRIVPDRWEFWQGRRDRMHDRFSMTPEGAGWRVQRLQP